MFSFYYLDFLLHGLMILFFLYIWSSWTFWCSFIFTIRKQLVSLSLSLVFIASTAWDQICRVMFSFKEIWSGEISLKGLNYYWIPFWCMDYRSWFFPDIPFMHGSQTVRDFFYVFGLSLMSLVQCYKQRMIPFLKLWIERIEV